MAAAYSTFVPRSPKFKDISGQNFGLLLAIRPMRREGDLRTFWQCRCDCGVIKYVPSGVLIRGKTVSCGAGPHREQHGKTNSRIYSIWKGMKNRCLRPSSAWFHLYGGRGIAVCERWHEFPAFLADMGEAPDGMQLDRIDNDKGYYKENCRWVFPRENCNNTRRNRWIEYRGQRLTITQLSNLAGIHRDTLTHRLGLGWSIEDAVNKAVKK